MTRWPMAYLKTLVDLALEDYNSFEKSPNFGDFTAAWYVLAKTGVAEHLSLGNRSVYPYLSRRIGIPGGWHGKNIEFGAYFFYVNSMVCSHKWSPATAEVMWERLRSLARNLRDHNDDLNETFWGDLRSVPFGEEAAYAFKCLQEKKMVKNLFGKLSQDDFMYYNSSPDRLTALHMICFDLGENEARKFIKLHWPLYPAEFSKMKKVAKNPRELSAFIESVTSIFAEKGNENWRGEEAKQYRTLSALHYLYPEVIENVSPFSKNYLIEKLNKRLAEIISSKNLNRNWEILYILRILELIDVDMSVHSW